MLRSRLGRVSCALALVGLIAGLEMFGPHARRASAQAAPLVHLYGRKDPLLPVRLDGHVALTWEGNLGLGGRVDFPLVTGTFRYSARDELALSVGGDVAFVSLGSSHRVEVFPSIALQWSLSVDDRFFFFPELGFVAHILGDQWEGVYPNIGFGARYYLKRSFGLQGRLGWPIALAGGVTF